MIERILYAAIDFHGRIFLGRRHHLIIRDIVQHTGVKHVPGSCEQGFLTNMGRFVGREEGGKIAIASGHIKRLRYNQRHLFSEELWAA